MDVTEVREQQDNVYWFVMRDLKRRNAKEPAYKMLSDEGFEVFTPMKWGVATQNGKRIRRKFPYMQDLLFVHATKSVLDTIVEHTATLQYRYYRGGAYREPMIVNNAEMTRFINAVSTTDNPVYYLPEELSPSMYGKRIRIIGGPLNGYEGNLLSIRGSRVKRLLVELPNFFTAGVEIDPDLIEIIKPTI